MAQFKSTVTDKGVLMMTQALAESKKITITRVEVGDGKYVGVQSTLTALVNKVNIFSGISGKVFIDDIMRVTVQIRNEGLIAPVYVREIGLIARIEGSTTDVLFGYAWLSGIDADNVVPVPVNPSFPDTFHQYEIGIKILNQIQALIQVQFAFDSFVTFEEMQTFIENFVTQIVDSPLLINISDRIGYPTDTASPTGNTLFKLIKWIVDRFTTHWTDARAAKIDTIDTKTGTINTNVATVNTKIGANTDVAGTSTIFAWMSKLWSEVSRITGLQTAVDAIKVVADNIWNLLNGEIKDRINSLSGAREEWFFESGTFTVPAGITSIYITACGGGGGVSPVGQTGGTGGGGGGAAIFKKKYTVVPMQQLAIIVGKGGYQANGGFTSIGSLVTLNGGTRGVASNFDTIGGGGTSGGAGGGAGGGGRGSGELLFGAGGGSLGGGGGSKKSLLADILSNGKNGIFGEGGRGSDFGLDGRGGRGGKFNDGIDGSLDGSGGYGGGAGFIKGTGGDGLVIIEW